jgi:hypothetical protein
VARNPTTPLRFEQHKVDGFLSIAHPHASSEGPYRLYVLGFSDDQRYVGQGRDVAGRFSVHRRRWSDIDTVDICRVPQARLDQVERDARFMGGDHEVVLRSGGADVGEHVQE